MNDTRPLVGRKVFISLGSNLGDRLQYMQRAVGAITQLPSTKVSTISSVYETEPVGEKNQPEFYNAVVELSTTLGPFELFKGLKGIEQSLGRTKTKRWGPREIDLDVLYYGTQVMDVTELSIPHPEIHNRRFVLVPLSEIAADFLDPATRQSVKQLLAQCVDTNTVATTSLKINIPTQEL